MEVALTTLGGFAPRTGENPNFHKRLALRSIRRLCLTNLLLLTFSIPASLECF